MSRTGTWDKLKIHPMKLMKMVISGEAKIVGKDVHGRYIYELLIKKGGRNVEG